ncbi:MAG: class I SAM-dependent methyltransferase [Marinoscillum sp.]
MEVNDAANLIPLRTNLSAEIEIWADLGCGAGTFTYALAMQLNPQSTIYAVDTDYQSLQTTYNQVEIAFVQSNFETSLAQLPGLHGVLMANSLHFIKDKKSFLLGLKSKLIHQSKLIIVEYDTSNANNWVPYPINFIALRDLISEVGFQNIEKIGERTSMYQSRMYALKATKVS